MRSQHGQHVCLCALELNLSAESWIDAAVLLAVRLARFDEVRVGRCGLDVCAEISVPVKLLGVAITVETLEPECEWSAHRRRAEEASVEHKVGTDGLVPATPKGADGTELVRQPSMRAESERSACGALVVRESERSVRIRSHG